MVSSFMYFIDIFSTGATLRDAVMEGDLERAQRLIEGGVPIDEKDEDGATALIIAALCGKHDIVDMLIEKGANVNETNVAGRSALRFAAREGHTRSVEILCRNKANVNIMDECESTPLMLAASKGRAEVVNVLLSNGANVNIRKSDGTTALICAAKEGHTSIVGLLLERNASMSATRLVDDCRWTSLMFAAANNQIDVCRCLLDRGADILYCNRKGQSARSLAASISAKEILKLIFQAHVALATLVLLSARRGRCPLSRIPEHLLLVVLEYLGFKSKLESQGGRRFVI